MRYRIRSALITITAAMLLGSGPALAASDARKADLNGNGVVNFADLAIMKSVFFVARGRGRLAGFSSAAAAAPCTPCRGQSKTEKTQRAGFRQGRSETTRPRGWPREGQRSKRRVEIGRASCRERVSY